MDIYMYTYIICIKVLRLYRNENSHVDQLEGFIYVPKDYQLLYLFVKKYPLNT